MMTPKVGHFYRLYDGTIAEVEEVFKDQFKSVADYYYSNSNIIEELLVTVAPKLRSGTVWVNIYSDRAEVVWASRKVADSAASIQNKRLACIEVSWEEGQGL